MAGKNLSNKEENPNKNDRDPWTPPSPSAEDLKAEEGLTKGSLAVIFLVVVIDLLGFGLVLPLLPIYAKHFTTDQTGVTIGLLMASFSFMQLCFSPIWEPYRIESEGDRF